MPFSDEHDMSISLEPQQPRPVITVVVVCCSGCPFVVASDDREAPWLCDAEGAVDGESDPRELPEQRVLPTGPPPPEWCPLRTTDRLVTLRLAPRGGQ